MDYDKKIQNCKDENVQTEKDIAKALLERESNGGGREQITKDLEDARNTKNQLALELK